MENHAITRRNWLKTGVLTAGGISLFPFSGICETPKTVLSLDAQGNAVYSPFFKEYLLEDKSQALEFLAKLNANENPYGPSPKAVAALQEAAVKGNRYAWKELFALIDQIAQKEGVAADNIIMGPGSSDILEKTAMVFFKNGGNVVSADPAYMSLIRVSEACGGTWKPVPLKEDWSHDLDAMEAAIDEETKLVYICNPNNPTGTITDSKALLDFCARVSESVTVFVDEAYLEFFEDADKRSMVALVSEGKDVLIARTFSKIHGMAGLRVGYGVGKKETLEKIKKITRGGMGISLPSVYAATASLKDVAFQNQSRSLNAKVREYTFKSLQKLGFDPVPSFTSFMIFPIAMDGKSFLKEMTDLQVGVRAFHFMEKDWCRVSMGTMDEMELFIQAVEKVLV